MAERFVLVTIKIDPADALCGACEWTDDNGEECRIFKAPLEWDNVNGPVRCIGCLALDDRELPPEEAIAHDFGSQP